MREPVNIERGRRDNRPGLPRPLARNNGVLRPVPWTNSDDGWGVLNEARAMEGERKSLCLVCGETVEDGYIFAKDKACPVIATQADLGEHASDFGPLHPRCAKMTVAHCAHIRNDLLHNGIFLVPYTR